MTTATRQVMVVDDSQAILMVMQAMLTELGINNITTCTSAIVAMEKVAQAPRRYDAIFTDLNMPEMDGMEFIRQLGEMKYPGGVVIISDMDTKIIDLAANLARQSNAHLIGNISKPVQLKEVARLLKKLESFIAPEKRHIAPIHSLSCFMRSAIARSLLTINQK